jgi:hypothetical protein
MREPAGRPGTRNHPAVSQYTYPSDQEVNRPFTRMAGRFPAGSELSTGARSAWTGLRDGGGAGRSTAGPVRVSLHQAVIPVSAHLPVPSSPPALLPPAGSPGPAVSSPGLTPPLPYTPPRCDVPAFPPIRVGKRGGRRLLRRAVRRRRRPLAAGLATTAAAVAVSAASHGAPPRVPAPVPRGRATAAARHTPVPVVRDPVRIADGAVVALLRPGDRVDVLAGGRVVAGCATVVAVPERSVPPSSAALADSGGPGGALVVLALPRPTAAALSGATTSSPVGVTLC